MITIKSAQRGFTLLEILIASTLTLVIVAIAMQFAAIMSLEARNVEQQGDLAVRASITASFLQAATDGIGYGWTVRQMAGTSSSDTDAPGVANCAVPQVCPETTTLPFQICEPTTVGAQTCAAQTAPTTTADAFRFFAPRDGVVQAVRILDRKATTLPSNCTLATRTTLDVQGVNASVWNVGDLVLVAKEGHVSVFSVDATFPAGTDALVTRSLTLNLGSPGNLSGDDGGSSVSCNASASLKGAGVYRLRLAVLRLNEASQEVEYATLVNTGERFAFQPVLADIDDFQVRLDLVRFAVAGGAITGASVCGSDTEAILSAPRGIPDCANARLNSRVLDGDVVRLIGVRLGIILRSRGGIGVARDVTGLFDRTAKIGTDRRLRRTVTLFVGLPNALL
jgi:prepilin-type N-terminal cleavage/methylation domain-containing protein